MPLILSARSERNRNRTDSLSGQAVRIEDTACGFRLDASKNHTRCHCGGVDGKKELRQTGGRGSPPVRGLRVAGSRDRVSRRRPGLPVVPRPDPGAQRPWPARLAPSRARRIRMRRRSAGSVDSRADAREPRRSVLPDANGSRRKRPRRGGPSPGMERTRSSDRVASSAPATRSWCKLPRISVPTWLNVQRPVFRSTRRASDA